MTTATAVRERPILFTGEMVRSILAGRKTVTRRVVKPPLGLAGRVKEPGGHRNWHLGDPNAVLACPYGQPGDRLWVRETGLISAEKDAFMYADHGGKLSPDAAPGSEAWAREWKSCPSIHMPRWASRLLSEVTEVRVERLQEISEADAIAEGITVEWLGVDGPIYGPGKRAGFGYDDQSDSAVGAFHHLWDAINAKRGHGWEINPWVWVVSFRRIEVTK